MEYGLFGWAAERYDLHTPPNHYQHDHGFVLEELSRLSPGSRILDVGCGTGVFLQKAREAGFNALGIDSSESMVQIARRRVGKDRVDIHPMQALHAHQAYAGLVSLSWSFNYCASLEEAHRVLERFAAALCPGGVMVLQVAHAPNASGRLQEDREVGPQGELNDVLFLYRFTREGQQEPTLLADYVYACHSLKELLFETHRLCAADVLRVAELAAMAGFEQIKVYDNWRRAPLRDSLSPFLVARREIDPRP